MTVEIIERIPHKDVSYAYLEIRASSTNEFLAARQEITKKHQEYTFAAKKAASPTVSATKPSEDGDSPAEPDQPADPVASVVDASPVPVTSSLDHEAEKGALTPREKARLRLKGA